METTPKRDYLEWLDRNMSTETSIDLFAALPILESNQFSMLIPLVLGTIQAWNSQSKAFWLVLFILVVWLGYFASIPLLIYFVYADFIVLASLTIGIIATLSYISVYALYNVWNTHRKFEITFEQDNATSLSYNPLNGNARLLLRDTLGMVCFSIILLSLTIGSVVTTAARNYVFVHIKPKSAQTFTLKKAQLELHGHLAPVPLARSYKGYVVLVPTEKFIQNLKIQLTDRNSSPKEVQWGDFIAASSGLSYLRPVYIFEYAGSS